MSLSVSKTDHASQPARKMSSPTPMRTLCCRFIAAGSTRNGPGGQACHHFVFFVMKPGQGSTNLLAKERGRQAEDHHSVYEQDARFVAQLAPADAFQEDAAHDPDVVAQRDDVRELLH